MGLKKEVADREKIKGVPSLEDPINSNIWKCVVILAVERSSCDSYILKEFMAEASRGRRQEVKSINFDCFVLKILNDFLNGELSFKYVFLLNFSSVLQEAAEFMKSEMDIPIPLLVKVVKALLFLLREESIIKIEKKSLGPPDCIRTMAKRPSNIGGVADNRTKSNVQKKELTTAGKSKRANATGDSGIRIKPPSATKEDTKLLKRGEGAKEDQYIDDAPLDGFNLYVLLTGFYHPDFPLELIKANIPLHGLLCIDTSLSSGSPLTPSTHSGLQKREANSERILNFWDAFLKIILDPTLSFYFKDVIFQVYTPQKPLCSNTKLKEFIYEELSYLMYDISDLKRQHDNYLNHMKLWDVNMKESDRVEESEELMSSIENLPSECVTVPVVVQYMLDVICFGEEKHLYGPPSVSFNSIDSNTIESSTSKPFLSPSILAKHSSSVMTLNWSNIINQCGDFNMSSVYTKTKELDVKYGIYDRSYWFETSLGKLPTEKTGSQMQQVSGSQRQRVFGGNLEEALNFEWSVFRSFWQNIAKKDKPYCLGYSVYLLLMTKVLCSFQSKIPVSPRNQQSYQSNSSFKKNIRFKRIEKVEQEMQNPHFSVTNCSRNVLRLIPYNIKELNRDFFCPSELKIVTPGKMKAISAPEFRKPPSIDTKISFLSDFIIPDEILQFLEFDVFEKLGYFLEENLFCSLNGFDFVEELSKAKLLTKEHEFNDYNCIDHFYSALTDSIFVMLHNRKDNSNTYHETFNEMLRTAIGLRDFFEYVLEDECLWLESQEKIYQSKLSHIGKYFEQNSDLKNYPDSDFWMNTSIKYQEYLKLASSSQKEIREVKTAKKVPNDKESKETKTVGNTGKPVKEDTVRGSNEFSSFSKSEQTFINGGESYAFEGYDVSDVAIQFSGLKTVYYASDCTIAVELIEKLHGNQHLGIHVRQGSHTLHLYSYVCPEPHLLDPYIFHLFYKNGIVVAFGKRFNEIFSLVEDEIVESKTILSKTKRNSSEASTTKRTKKVRKVSKRVEDDQFSYDMRLSMPNGLAITVVRKIVEPCYIKQWYLTKSRSHSEKIRGESKRLFLPNGNVVKIMEDSSVEILRVDASIVTSSLDHLSSRSEEKMEGTDSDSVLSLTKYEITTSEGLVKVINEGKMISSKRMEVFVNIDVESNTTFYRRMDGTNYLIQSDGSLCVQFKDGTKISNSIWVKQIENLNHSGDREDVEKINDEEKGFARIYSEVIMEHPDYATVIYNNQKGEWKILLPFDSAIKVESTGNYQVHIDGQTELKIDKNVICMNRFSTEHELLCQTTADLTVFEKGGKEIYCQMKDSSGKTFVVEPNSNCYVLSSEEINKNYKKIEGKMWQECREQTSQSQFVALDDLVSLDAWTEKTRKEGINKLSPENKYLVVRRDLTGFELLHRGDVMKALKKIKKNSVIFTQEIPGWEKLRCFVLIRPVPKVKSKLRKWEVESILPEPKFVAGGCKATKSSLYGSPPSWMYPFPKKKKVFEIPQELTCRVFIETKRSEFCPELGSLESSYSELGDLQEIRHSKIEPGLHNVLNYMKRLSNDDQDMLKEMYALTVGQILSMKRKLKPLNTEKLGRYLALSKHYMVLQMYHKKSIRYHLVPNYFDHPAGICWLVLNELTLVQHTSKKHVKSLVSSSSSSSSEFVSIFSNQEIEYNLTLSAKQSYSDLSCRTDITMVTAPMILTRGGVCTCKIKPVRDTTSAPITKIHDSENPRSSEHDVKTDHYDVCVFGEDEIKSLEQAKDERQKSLTTLTLKDLISLGLV